MTNGPGLESLRVPLDAEVRASFKPDLLGGAIVLAGTGHQVGGTETRPRPFVAIPYFAWANRGRGEMRVWLRR